MTGYLANGEVVLNTSNDAPIEKNRLDVSETDIFVVCAPLDASSKNIKKNSEIRIWGCTILSLV